MSECKWAKNLIGFWKDFEANRAPDQYIHKKDNALTNYAVDPSNPKATFDKMTPDQANDGFHCSLMPVPYLGNLTTADIFILLLNPVVGYSDYGTNACAEFQKALLQNRHQDFEGGDHRCLALDTRFWWSSWFYWYENMLRSTISNYAKGADKTYVGALEDLSRGLAIIELVPYYSSNRGRGKVTEKLVSELKSAQAAKEAAQKLVLRAADDEVLVVVMWGAKEWGIECENEAVVCNRARGLRETTREKIVSRLLRDQLPHRAAVIDNI